jgi:putative NIF3 family GTP cyclohydrolase 1 type 2
MTRFRHCHFRVLTLCLIACSLSSATAQIDPARPGPLTARQLIDRITTNLNGYWPDTGNDGLKDGDPATPVTGVAVTMMSTMDVLQRAAKTGANFIITHEPTFYSGNDSLTTLEKEQDAVTAEKRAFIRDHHLVVFRIHDHWHFPLRVPDPVVTGVFKVLDWAKYQPDRNLPIVVLPATTVGALAADISRRLGIRAARVVGDPAMPVTKVGFVPGSPGADMPRSFLQRETVEVLVIGEVREWETIEYVADAVSQGRHQALIVLGHVPSEQAGSTELVHWLQPLVPEIPVRQIDTAEPFWRPQ